MKTHLDLLRIALSEVGVMPSIPDALGIHRLPVSLLRLTAATHALMSYARRLTFPLADDALARLDRGVVDYERAAVWFDDRRDVER